MSEQLKSRLYESFRDVPAHEHFTGVDRSSFGVYDKYTHLNECSSDKCSGMLDAEASQSTIPFSSAILLPNDHHHLHESGSSTEVASSNLFPLSHRMLTADDRHGGAIVWNT